MKTHAESDKVKELMLKILEGDSYTVSGRERRELVSVLSSLMVERDQLRDAVLLYPLKVVPRQ